MCLVAQCIEQPLSEATRHLSMADHLFIVPDLGDDERL